ncbi:MAG: pyruvate dehydrogenase (acetyl-transferring) E1 component subunit alpha [Phycisphaerales bacterium]|nr:pyruvate dehydrogenase (acetyl-transferring) E1 component subunit alpha [Phycisphaerales bacterium]
MPRKPIAIENKLEHLSILDEHGTLDAKLEPKIPDKDLQKLYKTMLQSRLLDERCLHLQRQGRIGTYGPSKGQEAIPLGAAYCLKKDDWFVPSYRETAGFLWRGWPMGMFMLWWGGHEAGSAIPAHVNDTPLSVPIATQCQYGMGIAWGCKLRKDNTVCVAFVGDGGTSQGDFHEAMNFAAVYQAPLVMIVQNNHWAISLPRHAQTRSQTIAQKAIAYGIDGLQIDGNDILSVISAVREAVEKARAGGGPTLIEAVTYRLAMHTTADDPKKYRTEEEVKPWEARDPLPRFANYLRKKKLLDDKMQALFEEEIRKELDAAVAYYESYKHDPLELFKYMYQEMTPELRRQMAELEQHLGASAPKGAAHATAH